MLLYSSSQTNRLNYIADVLFKAIGLEEYRITTDKDFYCAYEGPKINYSPTVLSNNEIQILPVSLLFEIVISSQLIDVFLWNKLPAFFKTNETDIPFDLFAASFYLLTRYEEYLPHSLDMYGRYAHENSIAYQHEFLNIPLVNLWLKELAQLLQKRIPSLSLKPSAFSYLPSYDIDIAWSYLNKRWLRNGGGFVRSMVDGQWPMVKERMNVLLRKQQDPFDSYDWLNALHDEANLQPLYFFLVAKQNKGYDKNILPSNLNYQQLINSLAAKYEVGIHPSWQSGDDEALVTEELNTLSNITSKRITKSRQHYIRMKLPDTYRKLIAAGIKEDYSMGYGSINGFRASYCLPYKWYDLEKEATMSLDIYPFCYMEANSFYEQKYSTTEAQLELEHYHDVTKSVNGLLITIWHNHFLGTDKMFAGWREVYERFIRALASFTVD